MTMQWTLRKSAYLAAALWAVSFFLSLNFFEPAEIERIIGIFSGLTGLGLLVATGGELHTRAVSAPKIALTVIAFALLALGSAAWSVAPGVSLIYLGAFIMMPATILAVLVARPDVRNDFLCMTAWLCGIIVTGISIWALAQVFLLPEFLVNGRVGHPFPNPNAYAALLSLGFFAAFGAYVTLDDVRTRRALWVLMFFSLCAFVAIAGKAASIGLLTGCVLLVLLRGRVFLPANWKSLALLFIVVAAVGFAMTLRPDQRDSVSSVVGMLSGETGTIMNRIDIWHATLKLVEAHPWLGTGYRSFSLMYPSVRPASDLYSSGLMVHMDPLQFWVEMGILGPVLFYVIGIAVFVRFFAFYRTIAGTAQRHSVLILSLFLGCGAFIAHSHVDFLLYTLPTMMAFALMLSALMAKTEASSTAIPFSFMTQWPQNIRLFAVFVPVLAILCLYIPLMLGEYYSARATAMIGQENIDGFAKAVNTANRVDMGWGARPYMMATTIPLGLLKNQADTLPLDEQKKLFQQIDALTGKALARNSRLPTVWFQRGDMLMHVNSDVVPDGYITAEGAFLAALAIDPEHLPSRMALAELYRKGGDEMKEYEILMGGVGWPYGSFDPMPLYTRVGQLALTHLPAAERQVALDKIFSFQKLYQDRVHVAKHWKERRDRAAQALPFAP